VSVLAGQTRRGRARVRGCQAESEAGRRGQAPAPTLFDPEGGEPTLEDLVSGVWEGLAAQGRAACPLCGGEMLPGYAAHARPVEGRCQDCGTAIS
jgi:hypothetical protein